jgi:hypothetical protein
MKRKLWVVMVILVAAGVALAVGGCKKASPDDAETQALARQFMEAVYVNHDPALAMSLVVPITAYGYVTTSVVESTVADEVNGKCSTPADSIQTGAPAGDVTIPDISTNDTAKGITARTAWMVSSTFLCTGQSKAADRTAVVFLEKVNGKWGISKVLWQTGLGPQSPAG